MCGHGSAPERDGGLGSRLGGPEDGFADAGAIILAGGQSERMGRDKSLLPAHGTPVIQRLCEALQPRFAQVLVSANDAGKYAFLGVPVVPDAVAGQGPLAGIAAGLNASPCALNFVIACDIPEVNWAVLRRLFALAADAEAAVPRNADGRLEPLFAVYHRSLAPAMEQALARGAFRIREVFEGRRVRYLDLEATAWLRNMNTPEEYAAWIRASGADTGSGPE